MTDLLIRIFIKDPDNFTNEKVRGQYGTLSSITGICCNIILFLIKFMMGTLSNSVAIVSDAFNNLSDCFSCLITLAGYKLASQPADKDHPFGHGRLEYLSSLVIAVIIVFVGLEFLKTSVDKLLNPEPVVFRWIAVFALSASIALKVWMYFFNTKLGKKIGSSTMLATATDSLSDSITTAVTLISLFSALITDFPVDGIIGILVSFLILKAAWEIMKDTVDTLLGKPADEKTVQDMMDIIYSFDEILGVHDLIVHNYGPGKMMASLHAEVSSDQDILVAHDKIDLIEKKIYEDLHIMTVIHMDPIETNNEVLNRNQDLIRTILDGIDENLSMHDFRMVSGDSHTNLIFDIVVPYGFKLSNNQIKKEIDKQLHENNPNLYTVITFDTKYYE